MSLSQRLHTIHPSCCTRSFLTCKALICPTYFSCKITLFKSRAEGIRTPDLRRAKAARHFAGLSGACKIAANKRIYYSIAFPDVSEDLLGLLHGCCAGRLRSPSCIDAREQRKLATWTLLFPFRPRTPHVSNLHGGVGLSTLTTGGREASRWMIGLGA